MLHTNMSHLQLNSGKGGICVGQGGTKTHRDVFSDNIQDITKPAIRRLARHV